jgi:hypothetical protein
MKIRNISIGLLILAVVLSFSSCYYDKKELVYPIDTTGCDTAIVTYNSHIQSLLTEKCYQCHSGTAISGNGIKLDSYSGARAYGTSMVGQVESGVMPQGGPKLSSCNIARIRTWVRNGSPEK